jgi:hypothetical protein
MFLIGSLELWVSGLNLLLLEIKEEASKMETDQFIEGAKATLDLIEKELGLLFSEASLTDRGRINIDLLLDAKAAIKNIRLMMLSEADNETLGLVSSEN